MRRMSVTCGVVWLALIAIAAMGSATLAQDASPAAMAGHPLIGAWIVDNNTRDDRSPANVVTFGAEGNVLDSNPGGTGAGSWEATGPSSATVTLVSYYLADESGAISSTIIRADVVLSDDGQSFTSTYTLEVIEPDGTSSGQLGPVDAAGTRLVAQPMGSPVAPLPVQAPEPSAEASPTS